MSWISIIWGVVWWYIGCRGARLYSRMFYVLCVAIASVCRVWIKQLFMVG